MMMMMMIMVVIVVVVVCLYAFIYLQYADLLHCCYFYCSYYLVLHRFVSNGVTKYDHYYCVMRFTPWRMYFGSTYRISEQRYRSDKGYVTFASMIALILPLATGGSSQVTQNIQLSFLLQVWPHIRIPQQNNRSIMIKTFSTKRSFPWTHLPSEYSSFTDSFTFALYREVVLWQWTWCFPVYPEINEV
jgi:hypothetical protein